jgi:hypothetical protein
LAKPAGFLTGNQMIKRTILLALLLFPLGSWALGLNDITVNSFLNEKLDARIELTSASPGMIDDIRVALANPARQPVTVKGPTNVANAKDQRQAEIPQVTHSQDFGRKEVDPALNTDHCQTALNGENAVNAVSASGGELILSHICCRSNYAKEPV